jgi:hypothetical protein
MELTASVEQSERVCKKCGESKPLGKFANSGVTPDKKHPLCDPCRRAGIAAGLEKRRQAKGKTNWGGDDRNQAGSILKIDKEELWEMFDLVTCGSVRRFEQVEAIFAECETHEVTEKKEKIKTAYYRVVEAIVARWGKP